jgi:hypothetical protein
MAFGDSGHEAGEGVGSFAGEGLRLVAGHGHQPFS